MKVSTELQRAEDAKETGKDSGRRGNACMLAFTVSLDSVACSSGQSACLFMLRLG